MYLGYGCMRAAPGRLEAEGAMFADQTRTVLILPQALLDRARVFAGEATSQLKRMVSLQMVLRALIDEGLKQHGGRGVLANVEGQAQAIRRIRRRVAWAGRAPRAPASSPVQRSRRGRHS
jgi:hypothetical protein